MSDTRPDLLVVLNPWQKMMAAIFYSVLPDLVELPPVLLWNPDYLQTYAILKTLSADIKDAAGVLDELLPLPSAELGKRIDMRLESLTHAFSEPSHLLSTLRPRKLLILADALPTHAFWQAVPGDAEVYTLVWNPGKITVEQREQIEDRLKNTAFSRFQDSISWIESAVDLVIWMWQTVRKETFPSAMDMLLTSDQPDGILTGMYHARKEGIPLLVSRPLEEEQSPKTFKVRIERGKDVWSKPVQEYPFLHKARLCEIPRFTCVLETKSNLEKMLARLPSEELEQLARRKYSDAQLRRNLSSDGMDVVTTIVYAFQQEGQIVLNPMPAIEAVDEAELALGRINDLIQSGAIDQAYQELRYLSELVTRQIPQHVQEALIEYPEKPVQIVGTPFPYSLCRIPNGVCYWAETYSLAFLPIADAAGVLLRNRALLVHDESDVTTSLCVMIDSLSSRVMTETQSLADALRSRGSYCINLRGSAINVARVKSIFNYVPIDICLFVAHGAKSGIVLTEDSTFSSQDVLSADEIKSLAFPGSPFIINNSCFSWTEVGSAFVEGRARGFIGTYWTVENISAVDIAQTLMTQLLEGQPASIALKTTIRGGEQNFTHLAYLFVGLHDARLSNRSSAHPNRKEIVARAWARILSSAEDAILNRGDRSSALTLSELIPPLEYMNMQELPASLVNRILSIQFNFAYGLGEYKRDAAKAAALIEEGLRAIDAVQQEGDERELYRLLAHLGLVYYSRGKQDDLQQAEEYLCKALEIERRLRLHQDEARDLGNLGVIEHARKNYTAAIDYHKQALAINTKIGNTRDQIMDLQNIASEYLALDDITASLEHAQDALDLHDSVEEFRVYKLPFCLRMARELIGKGRYEAANDFLRYVPLQSILEVESPSPDEILWSIESLMLHAEYRLSRDDGKKAEEYYEIASELARQMQWWREYFSIQYQRVSLLQRMRKFQYADHLRDHLLVELKYTEKELGRDLYEAIVRSLEDLALYQESEFEDVE